MKFFALLVCAHILGDFLLQPDCMAKHKNNNWVFLLHLFIHGLVGWLCIAQWNVWVVPLYIFATHGLLDWVKRRMSDTAQSFIVDQCLHLLTLFLLGYYLNSSGLLPPSNVLLVKYWKHTTSLRSGLLIQRLLLSAGFTLLWKRSALNYCLPVKPISFSALLVS